MDATALYKLPGDHTAQQFQNCKANYMVAHTKAELDAALKDGWYLKLEDAEAAYAKVKK